MEYPFKDLMPLDEATARDGYYKDWTHIDANTFHQISELVKFIREKGYGSDTREAIAQALERVYYDAMKSGNADMELSMARKHFKDLASRLDASDNDLRNISVDWINKNLGKLDQTFMSEEFLQQMAGTTPINAVPADESVTTSKLTEGAVTGSKAAFFKTTRNLFDLEKIERGKGYNAQTKAFTTNAGTYVFKFPVVEGQAITIKDGLGSGNMGHGFMDASGTAITTHISNVTGPATYTAPTGAVEMIMTGVIARINSQQIELGEETEYIPNRILDNRFIENPVTNRDNTYAYLVALGGVIDVNTVAKSISLPAGAKYVFYGGKLVSLPTTAQSVPYQNGFLYIDTVTNTLSSGDVVDVRNKPHLLMLGYIANDTVYLNAKHTVNGGVDLAKGSISAEVIRSNLFGKKGVTFGDSITWYDGQPFGASHSEAGTIAIGYQSYMREILGCVVDNKGASGQDMLAISNIIKSYASYANTDFVTISSGANDERKGVPVGTIQDIGSSFDLTSYTGTLQSAIEHVINTNKQIKIYLMTPIRGWYNEYGTTDVPNTDPSVVGMMSEKYANATKAVGKLYGYPVLDWYNDTGLNELNKNTFLGDGLSLPYFLHPTNEFYERMASPLIPFLNNN